MSKVSMILNLLSAHKKVTFRAAQIGVRNISISRALRKTHYEVLGVPPDATQADIKNAYFELSKLYHPDRIAATDENIAKFREVSAAYEILGNEQSRKLYDSGLIGELKKPGEEEITDPIVKFYQRRMEVTRSQAKGTDDLDAWTQTYFQQLQASSLKKHGLFSKSKQLNYDHLSNPYRHFLQAVIALALSVYVMFSFKGSNLEKSLRKLIQQ